MDIAMRKDGAWQLSPHASTKETHPPLSKYSPIMPAFDHSSGPKHTISSSPTAAAYKHPTIPPKLENLQRQNLTRMSPWSSSLQLNPKPLIAHRWRWDGSIWRPGAWETYHHHWLYSGNGEGKQSCHMWQKPSKLFSSNYCQPPSEIQRTAKTCSSWFREETDQAGLHRVQSINSLHAFHGLEIGLTRLVLNLARFKSLLKHRTTTAYR